jgi:hypothetical protein
MVSLPEDGLAGARPGFVDRLIHADYVSRAGLMLTCERSAGRLSHTRLLRA